MNNNPSASSPSAAPASPAEQQSISSPATSGSSGHRPRQFQFRKGPGASLPRPEGETSDFKSRVLRHWSDWVADFDRRNEAALKRLSEEHGCIWRETPRVPLVLQPLSHLEQRAFSTGHLQSHVSMRDSSSGSSAGSHQPNSASNSGNNQQQHGQRPPYQKKKFVKDQAGWRDESEKKDNEEGDEEILWATEESGVGMFDAQGHFKFITESVLQDQSAVKSQIDKSVLFGSRGIAHSSPPVVPEPKPEPPVVVESNEWYYKDPKGNIQGPFQSTQMLEWYNRRYFPDNLPLKRATDSLFEPLSIWKLRCEGRSPFEVVKPQQTAAPGFASPPITAAPEIIRFGSLSSADDPIVNVPVRKSPIVSPVPAAVSPQPLKPQSEPEPKENEVDKQARFLESLMLKNKSKSATSPQSVAPEPVSLQAIMAEQAEQVKTKYSAPVPAPAIVPAPLSNPVSTPAAAPAAPAVPATQPAVAWKTVNSAPTASLVDIKRQQENEVAKAKQQQHQQQQQQQSSGPKSFADLLAASSTSTSGAAIAAEPKKAVVAPIAKPSSTTTSTSVTQQPPRQSAPTKPAIADPLKEWMSTKLKTVEAVDVGFLYSLLAECHSSEEAAILLRDNLLTIADDSVDLKAFSKEYLKRRFGKHIPAYVLEIVSPRVVDDRDLRPEPEFSTVTRKKK